MTDAWDDDWTQKADTSPTTAIPIKLSKAEKRAKQAEFNRQLWEDAENPQDNFFLRSQGIVPLKEDFKPTMKVLSRKPVAVVKQTQGSAEGDDDDDEDGNRTDVLTPEQRFQKAQQEREEKQKAYEERRRQLFGENKHMHASNKTARPQSRSHRGTPNPSRPASAASNKPRQLFDPAESTKPDSQRPTRSEGKARENQPIREPRAPDSCGKGFQQK